MGEQSGAQTGSNCDWKNPVVEWPVESSIERTDWYLVFPDKRRLTLLR